MTATARVLAITEEDLEGGGSYAALEVPEDYEATLTSVEDYDYTDQGKSSGWIFDYEVENLSFKSWLAHSQGARWKVIEVLTAHGIDVEEGTITVDPNTLVGQVVGARVDYQKDPDEHDAEMDGPNYKEIKWMFPLGAASTGDEVEVL